MKGDERIVKPEWITASVAAGKLLDCSQYLLMFNQDKNQQKITFQPVSVSNDKNPTDSKEKVEDSKWVAKDATDSRFLGEFFNNSRLHHIATMGANAKDYATLLGLVLARPRPSCTSTWTASLSAWGSAPGLSCEAGRWL